MTDFDRIRELEAAATPGPWAIRPAKMGIRSGYGDLYAWVLRADGLPIMEKHNAGTMADVEFAAASRNAIPALLASLDKAEAEREYWRLGMDRHGRCVCNTGPDTDGPEEDCPHHGRRYSEWVEAFATAEVDRGRWRQLALQHEIHIGEDHARIAVVREMHFTDDGKWCHQDGFGYPCPTIRAIDGEATT